MALVKNNQGNVPNSRRTEAGGAEGRQGSERQTGTVHVQHTGRSRQTERYQEEGEEAEGFRTLFMNLYPSLPG